MNTEQWVSDANGNRCSAEYFGSIEAAQAALDSLKNCKNCTNCSDCSGCLRCSDCSGCSGCSDCSGCLRCSGLEGRSPIPGEVAWKIPPTPIIENIHQVVYAAASAPKALNMSDWHTCDTTHCRAGWVVTLAGEAGRALEEATTTLHAAMRIYRASDPTWRMSDFFASNESALADMKRLAEIGSANHESSI